MNGARLIIGGLISLIAGSVIGITGGAAGPYVAAGIILITVGWSLL